ncbi:MAG: carboxypeptidase-like regulatory domain-containing protein, partial [Acidobacteria bacterium]|nr:carboxypeptidase-like regulatory domain-containing protein [Acidobacteriota bacterium]
MKERLYVFALGLLATASAYGQAPTGSIIGTVTDPSGAVVPTARVELRNQQTGFRRIVETTSKGEYNAPALPPGGYHITVEAAGFQRVSREALVEAGLATTLNISLTVGPAEQVVNVSAVTPQIRYDRFDISGIVTQGQVERLPLNGRNFLELAKLEPGAQQLTRGANNRTFVPLVGAPNAGNPGARTRVTVDGGSIMGVNGGGVGMGLSQEIVQEFQVATINFDLSTGITASGAVNVVTRTGSNDFHASAFVFFRDHHLSAYPGLVRNAQNRDSFFQRRQFGITAGGPLRKEAAFFFATFERNEQRGVIATEVLTPDFSALSRITPSPLYANQASMRTDIRLGSRNTAFLRYSHEDLFAYTTTALRSTGFGSPAVMGVGAGSRALPSAWTRQPAWADQMILGLTSQVRPHLVNDLRFSYFFGSSSEEAPSQADCAGCLGIGAPAISVNPDLFIGNSTTTRLLGRRLHVNDVVAWQRGSHRLRFGGDWELNLGETVDTGNQPVTMTLYSPQQVRDFNA